VLDVSCEKREADFAGCSNTLVLNLFGTGISLLAQANSLTFVIPDRFSGEKSAFATFSAAC